jgi:hypothetical protein
LHNVTNAIVYSYGIPQDDAARTGVGSPDIMQTNFTGVQNNFSAAFAPFSATVMVLSPRDPPPLPPANVLATASNSAVALTWSPAAGADNYIIRRTAMSGGNYVDVGTNATQANFIDTGLVNGTAYYYVIAASNTYGVSSNSAPVGARPTSSAAVAMNATNAIGQLRIFWPADHTGWQLQAQTNNLGTNWVNVAGSDFTNLVPLNTTNDSVFFRLMRPY